MKKFQSNVNRELSRSYPDRRRLETQCLSALAFVKAENDIIDCPIWVLIINVVAMDMLKSKLPPGKTIKLFFLKKLKFTNWCAISVQRPFDIRNRPRIPIPDEDPYVAADIDSSESGFGNGLYGASRDHMMIAQSQYPQLVRRDKPPKLPPRDNMYGHHDMSSLVKVKLIFIINLTFS